MKNKILFTVILNAIFFQSIAQNESASKPPLGYYSFGIYLGAGLQNINGKDASGNKLNNSLVSRFNAGFNEEIPLAPEFFLQVGLQYISKGTMGVVDYNTNSGTQKTTRELKLNYFEMPLNFIFKPMLGNNHIVLGFGPYLGYCFSGKAIYTGSFAPDKENIVFVKTVPSNTTNNLVYFKRFDTGANFLVGYEMHNGINLTLNSQLGLININSNTESQLANKNTGFSLALGYRF
jgi:hypothetical protein